MKLSMIKEAPVRVFVMLSALMSGEVWAQAAASIASQASGGQGTTLGAAPPRVPYLLIVVVVVVAVIAVLALVIARRALAEVRDLKGQLDGMKKR